MGRIITTRCEKCGRPIEVEDRYGMGETLMAIVRNGMVCETCADRNYQVFVRERRDGMTYTTAIRGATVKDKSKSMVDRDEWERRQANG